MDNLLNGPRKILNDKNCNITATPQKAVPDSHARRLQELTEKLDKSVSISEAQVDDLDVNHNHNDSIESDLASTSVIGPAKQFYLRCLAEKRAELEAASREEKES